MTNTDRIFIGSEEEFENIVNKNKLIVYSTVLANTNSAGDVDDIVQETFIYAYYNFGALREAEKLTSWLCGIARNKSRTLTKKRRETLIDDLTDEPVSVSAEDVYIENYAREEVIRQINSLSEKLRETITLFYIGGKSIKEIAEILLIPEGTVKFRLNDGRKKLKLKKELAEIMAIEKNKIADTELYAKVKENIDTANDYIYKQNKKKDASELCDKTLAMISENPSFVSEAADDPERLLVNLYHAKAAAINLVESGEEHVKYLAKAVEIVEKAVEKSGDLKWLANEYSYYSNSLSNAGKEKDANIYVQKAIEAAEKSGDKKLYASNLFWQATKYWESSAMERGIDSYKKVLEFKEELKGDCTYALANGSYKALSAIKAKGKMQDLKQFISVCPGVKYTEGKAVLCGEPGFSAPGGVYLHPLHDIIECISDVDNLILDNNFKEGYTLEKEGFSYTYTPVKRRLEVVSMAESITVIAGSFTGCIHTRIIGTPTDPDDDTSRMAELNRKVNGVVDVWFAPNVGIIKASEKPIIGDHGYTMELTEYKINNPDESELIKKYFPIAEGNMWRYDTFDKDGNPLRDRMDYECVFEVEDVSEENNLISHWGYAYNK